MGKVGAQPAISKDHKQLTPAFIGKDERVLSPPNPINAQTSGCGRRKACPERSRKARGASAALDTLSYVQHIVSGPLDGIGPERPFASGFCRSLAGMRRKASLNLLAEALQKVRMHHCDAGRRQQIGTFDGRWLYRVFPGWFCVCIVCFSKWPTGIAWRPEPDR